MTDDIESQRDRVRRLFMAHYDADAAADYDAILALGLLDDELLAAMVQDISPLASWNSELEVLDIGAGTGALCQVLLALGCRKITALEPCVHMMETLKAKPHLSEVVPHLGFSDAPEDRAHFLEESFDIIVSRQLANSLVDPIQAFRNWKSWLKPGGSVILMDGFYDRESWARGLGDLVDLLPLSANQSLALIPYMLVQAGFQVESCNLMKATNALPRARTPRYVVVARSAP